MKPFNLERALAGDKVVCRDHYYRVVSIIDATVGRSPQRLQVEVLDHAGQPQSVLMHASGRAVMRSEGHLDLFMPEDSDHAAI